MSGSNWNGGETFEEGDNIRVWNPSTTEYTIYYYYTDDSHLYDGWYDMGGAEYFDDCAENADGLEAGWNAWYQSKGVVAPTVTMSGAIAPEDDVSITILGGGYSLISNPFPVNFQPNDANAVDWGDITGGETFEEGDNIRIWNPTTTEYTIYYYYTDETHLYDGWYDMGGAEYFEDCEGNENGIAAGEVFWYQSKALPGTSHKIKFLNPTK